MGQNQRRRVCFVKFARWRHRGRSLSSPTASCWSLEHYEIIIWSVPGSAHLEQLREYVAPPIYENFTTNVSTRFPVKVAWNHVITGSLCWEWLTNRPRDSLIWLPIQPHDRWDHAAWRGVAAHVRMWFLSRLPITTFGRYICGYRPIPQSMGKRLRAW